MQTCLGFMKRCALVPARMAKSKMRRHGDPEPSHTTHCAHRQGNSPGTPHCVHHWGSIPGTHCAHHWGSIPGTPHCAHRGGNSPSIPHCAHRGGNSPSILSSAHFIGIALPCCIHYWEKIK